MHCGVFLFTSVCSFNALTLLVGSFKNPSPYGLYYVGGTLSLTQSINQSEKSQLWFGIGGFENDSPKIITTDHRIGLSR